MRPLATVIDGLILQAKTNPRPLDASRQLLARIRLMRDTPARKWPAGVTAADFSIACERLRVAARELRELANGQGPAVAA